MSQKPKPLLSVIIPVHNEAAGIADFHKSLVSSLKKLPDYELIYVEDGSLDDSAARIAKWTSPRIRLIRLSRNFGKEIATTAGIQAARGQAIITIDADGQHPVDLIPRFIKEWRAGAKVVVGLRDSNQGEGFVKKYGSKLFYKLFNRFTGTYLVPGATDFRLLDQSVQAEFKRMTERNRMTRALVDWLGFRPIYISFRANPRSTGQAGYSFKKLFGLAVNSVISHSMSPLYITAYIGAVVLPLSGLLGIFMLVNALLGDPAHLHATGSAYAIVMTLFLIGIIMMSQGIIGLYLSHIHTETQNRPLYIIESEMGGQNDKT